MSPSKPNLVAVEAPRKAPADQRPLQPRPPRPNRRIQLALVVSLVAAVVAVVWQTQRVDALFGQVERLEVELGAAQQALSVYENRFGEIRASVGDLRDQLGELEALVESPPTPTPAP